MSEINLDNESKEKLKRLPLTMRSLAKMLVGGLNDLVSEDCSEEEVIRTIHTIQSAQDDKYGNDDVVNYDEACRLLGLEPTNRVGLKKIINAHKIKQITINNVKIGFSKKEILKIKDNIKK